MNYRSYSSDTYESRIMKEIMVIIIVIILGIIILLFYINNFMRSTSGSDTNTSVAFESSQTSGEGIEQIHSAFSKYIRDGFRYPEKLGERNKSNHDLR